MTLGKVTMSKVKDNVLSSMNCNKYFSHWLQCTSLPTWLFMVYKTHWTCFFLVSRWDICSVRVCTCNRFTLISSSFWCRHSVVWNSTNTDFICNNTDGLVAMSILWRLLQNDTKHKQHQGYIHFKLPNLSFNVKVEDIYFTTVNMMPCSLHYVGKDNPCY